MPWFKKVNKVEIECGCSDHWVPELRTGNESEMEVKPCIMEVLGPVLGSADALEQVAQERTRKETDPEVYERVKKEADTEIDKKNEKYQCRLKEEYMRMIVMNLFKSDQKVWIDCFASEETKQFEVW
jgi:hypothetical protein